MKKTSQCEMLLSVLEDGLPHTQFAILEEIKNRFYEPNADLSFWSVAARAWDLIKPKGAYKLNVKSGTPAEFGKERIANEHYYQLIKKPKQQNFLNPVHQEIIDNITLKPLTKEYMKSHSQDIKEILG